MAYCFASSRDSTMMRSGRPIWPVSSRRTSVCPSEPVPPVIRTTAPSRVGVMVSLSSVLVDHRRPAGDLDAGGAAEPARVEGPVDPRLVGGPDLARDCQGVAQGREQCELGDRLAGDMVKAAQAAVIVDHGADDARQCAR